jgi:hypothetical protein
MQGIAGNWMNRLNGALNAQGALVNISAGTFTADRRHSGSKVVEFGTLPFVNAGAIAAFGLLPYRDTLRR